VSEAQAFHIPNLTIQFYPSTQEGQAMVSTQEVFCLAGDLYQGYKGAICDVHERTLLEEEMLAIHDVDGTLHRVQSSRKSRLGSRDYRKKKEYAKLDAEKRQQRLADLELLEKERALGIKPTDSPVVPDEEKGEKAPPEPVAAVAPVAEIAVEVPIEPVEEAKPDSVPMPLVGVQVHCDECLKGSPPGHRNPANWLRGHKFGAHKRKK